MIFPQRGDFLLMRRIRSSANLLGFSQFRQFCLIAFGRIGINVKSDSSRSDSFVDNTDDGFSLRGSLRNLFYDGTMENELENPPTIELAHEKAERKFFAFVMTFAACFVLLALLWPLSVKGFRTQASVSVVVGESDSAKQQFQDTFVKFIRSRTDDTALSRLMEAVEQNCRLESPALRGSDFEKIRESLSVNAIPISSSDGFRLDFAYDGNGSEDERYVVQLLADDLATALIGTAGQTTNHESMVGRLNWLVSQAESDMAVVRSKMQHLTESAGSGARSSSPFRNASHRSSSNTNVSEIPELADIQSSLAAIDMRALRTTVAELRETKTTAGSNKGSGKSVSRLETTPIGGVPRTSHVVFISLLSLLVGSVVASNFQAFSPQGFEDTSTVASRLKVPVLASIPSRSSVADSNSSSGGQALPVANRVGWFAKAVLLCVIGLTIFVCCLNPEIRQAFLQNPFHGFSRLVWLFVGH